MGCRWGVVSRAAAGVLGAFDRVVNQKGPKSSVRSVLGCGGVQDAVGAEVTSHPRDPAALLTGKSLKFIGLWNFPQGESPR